jgi:hypothetical protein
MVLDPVDARFSFYLGYCHSELKEDAIAKKAFEACIEIAKHHHSHPENVEFEKMAKIALTS